MTKMYIKANGANEIEIKIHNQRERKIASYLNLKIGCVESWLSDKDKEKMVNNEVIEINTIVQTMYFLGMMKQSELYTLKCDNNKLFYTFK